MATDVVKTVTGINYAATALSDKLNQQDTPLIDELNGALDVLGEAFEQGDHSHIRSEAANVISIIGQIFAKPNSENFKNIGTATRWTSYLSPVKNLLTLLETYLRPSVATRQPEIYRMQQALKPVQDLVKGEVNYQQGIVARAVTTAWDQAGREVNKTIRGLTGSASPVEPAVKQHPLIQLSELIGTYLAHGDDYLSVSKENKLASALRHLDQKSISFKVVEAFVYQEIPEGKLQANLEPLIARITTFLEEEANPQVLTHLYKSTVEQTYMRVRRTDNTTEQIKRAKQYVASNGLVGTQALWNAGAEFDKLVDLRDLAKTMQKAAESPTDLSQKIDVALRFFQKDPSALGIGPEVLKAVSQAASGWLSVFHTWVSEELEPSELTALEGRLNRLKQQMNRGHYYSALTELKEELQKSPLSKRMHESTDSVSPLNTIQDIKDKQAKTISPKSEMEITSWENAMKAEKERLVDQVGYLSTFKTIYNVIGTPTTRVDPLEFQKQSDAAYARIMTAVDEAPLDKQQDVFISKVKDEIEKREDITFFKKALAKLTTWVIMLSVRFFTKHFIGSFIDYLTNTISLPTRQPLSTVHLSPVERVNDCFIAQKKALSRWAGDESGEEFGPLGRKKALEIGMRAPELNGGYEHDDLVERTTKCAIDKFLTLDGMLSNSMYAANREIEQWVNASSGITHAVKYIASAIPQLVVTAGWLISKGFEKVSSVMLRFAAKRFMLSFNLSNTMLDSMKDSLYKQSQYTNAIDEVLLYQLLEVEKLLEEGGGEAIEHEGEEAKKLFREAVANAVRVIDLNRNLTAESLKKAESPRDNALSEATDTVKELADEQLRNAIVQLLIIVYQSILTEEQMNGLILKIFKKTNDSLFPQTVIQMYYSEDEKEKMTKELGHKPTDAELKAKFAAARGKNPSQVTDAEIQSEMKVRFNKTEQALRETTFRVIKKSVHQVVQEEGKNALMTAGQSVIHYIDFLDRYLFESNGSRATSFFHKTREAFKSFEEASTESERQETLESLNKETLEFLKEYEKKQQLLDKKVTGKDQTTAHVRRMNEISNTDIMPQLMTFQKALQSFLRNKDAKSLETARNELDGLYSSVYKHQAELEQIKQEELRLQSHGETLSEKARIWGGKLIRNGAPVALDQVELYANLRLNQIADGAFHLYKDANTFESFLRHVVMLNFVESLGYKKGIKA